MTRYLDLAAIAGSLALGLPLAVWTRQQEATQPPLRWAFTQHGSQPRLVVVVTIGPRTNAGRAAWGFPFRANKRVYPG
jgi:hypothetical protein